MDLWKLAAENPKLLSLRAEFEDEETFVDVVDEDEYKRMSSVAQCCKLGPELGPERDYLKRNLDMPNVIEDDSRLNVLHSRRGKLSRTHCVGFGRYHSIRHCKNTLLSLETKFNTFKFIGPKSSTDTNLCVYDVQDSKTRNAALRIKARVLETHAKSIPLQLRKSSIASGAFYVRRKDALNLYDLENGTLEGTIFREWPLEDAMNDFCLSPHEKERLALVSDSKLHIQRVDERGQAIWSLGRCPPTVVHNFDCRDPINAVQWWTHPETLLLSSGRLELYDLRSRNGTVLSRPNHRELDALRYTGGICAVACELSEPRYIAALARPMEHATNTKAMAMIFDSRRMDMPFLRWDIPDEQKARSLSKSPLVDKDVRYSLEWIRKSNEDGLEELLIISSLGGSWNTICSWSSTSKDNVIKLPGVSLPSDEGQGQLLGTAFCHSLSEERGSSLRLFSLMTNGVISSTELTLDITPSARACVHEGVEEEQEDIEINTVEEENACAKESDGFSYNVATWFGVGARKIAKILETFGLAKMAPPSAANPPIPDSQEFEIVLPESNSYQQLTEECLEEFGVELPPSWTLVHNEHNKVTSTIWDLAIKLDRMAKRCPQGHLLKKQQYGQRKGYHCDICLKLSGSYTLRSCRPCDFDMCEDCRTEERTRFKPEETMSAIRILLSALEEKGVLRRFGEGNSEVYSLARRFFPQSCNEVVERPDIAILNRSGVIDPPVTVEESAQFWTSSGAADPITDSTAESAIPIADSAQPELPDGLSRRPLQGTSLERTPRHLSRKTPANLVSPDGPSRRPLPVTSLERTPRRLSRKTPPHLSSPRYDAKPTEAVEVAQPSVISTSQASGSNGDPNDVLGTQDLPRPEKIARVEKTSAGFLAYVQHSRDDVMQRKGFRTDAQVQTYLMDKWDNMKLQKKATWENFARELPAME